MVLAGLGGTAAAAPADFPALAAAVAKAFPAAAPISVIEVFRHGRDREVAKLRLGNGLTVLLLEDHSAPIVSFQSWYGVGSRFERKGRTGIAHLFEHLMFKGTTKFPHDVFDRILEEAGAQTNAATWLDWTFYYENLPAGQLDLAASMESDRMVHLVLTQAQLDSEREVVKNERRLRVDNDPDGAMEEALFESVFPHHPYGVPTIGYMPDLDALSLEEALAFYRTYYSPGNATLVIVGDVTAAEALRIVARHYGGIPAVEVPRPVPPPEAEQQAYRAREMTLPVATDKAKMAWRAVPANHPDVYPLEVANEVLFANESARVYKVLVEEKELASDVDGAVEPLALDGLFLCDVVAAEGKPVQASIDAVLAEAARLAAEGPSEVELNRAKNHAEAGFLRSLSTAGSRATQLGGHELTGGDFKRMFQYVDGVRAVTAADVARVAGRYLARDRASVVIAHPEAAK